MIPKLNEHNHNFPNPRHAGKEGLVAWGGDLSTGRILSAYERGIFPWFNPSDPILWWSPNPRLILEPDAIRITSSLRKSMRHFDIKYDNDFASVIRLCRDIRLKKGESSWIFDAIIKAYTTLHVEGFAHSVECYQEGELVGGLYGLYLGGVFCGESMFSLRKDASKAALVGLCEKIKALDGDFIDCQIPTAHLKSMGAVEISRDDFLLRLEQALKKTVHKEWKH